jgi:hypothetical protein
MTLPTTSSLLLATIHNPIALSLSKGLGPGFWEGEKERARESGNGLFSIQLLSKPKFSGVEKIKTIGSTYMAATGLNATSGQDTQQVQQPFLI